MHAGRTNGRFLRLFDDIRCLMEHGTLPIVSSGNLGLYLISSIFSTYWRCGDHMNDGTEPQVFFPTMSDIIIIAIKPLWKVHARVTFAQPFRDALYQILSIEENSSATLTCSMRLLGCTRQSFWKPKARRPSPRSGAQRSSFDILMRKSLELARHDLLMVSLGSK